jgi:hypothetical protein
MAFSQQRMEVIQSMSGGAHGLVKIKKAHIASPTDNTETATGITLPTNSVVLDVFLYVRTVDADETVDIGTQGTSNDPNGFMVGASLATAGFVRTSLANGALTRGALLVDDEDGSGALVPTSCVTAGGDPISYTTSAGTDTAVFDVWVTYFEL